MLWIMPDQVTGNRGPGVTDKYKSVDLLITGQQLEHEQNTGRLVPSSSCRRKSQICKLSCSEIAYAVILTPYV